MMTAIVSILTALAVLTLLLTIPLAAVVLGIRQEPANTALRNRAPSVTAYLTRRLLGVYVCRPDEQTHDQREACLTGQAFGNGHPDARADAHPLP